MTYFTTNDGHTLTVYSSLYMDYGLTITKDGEELFSNPHVLSHESYGSKPSEDYDDMEEAEEALENGDENAIVPWEDSDWSEMLELEADELIEAFIVKDFTTTNQTNGANHEQS
ncbi:MAG TPA: hypothetical protein EYN67_00825 [Flavobacteriales bacterium]|nr:hypothetical protein [Flavobacteriales bacterium]